MKRAMSTGSFVGEEKNGKSSYRKKGSEPIRSNRLPETELSSAARELVDLLVEVALSTQVDFVKSDGKRSSNQ